MGGWRCVMATDNPYPATWALQGVQEGLSARAALRDFRSAGGHVADSTWYKVYGEVAAQVSLREGIYSEPQNLRPVASEIQQWSTVRATGYIQQVEVLVRDKGTGEIISVPYSSLGKTLRSRRSVINEALEVYSDENAEKYNQTILGAVYSGTYQGIPGS
jgi:hypothetical protein